MTTKRRIYSVGGNKRIKDGQGDPVLGYDVADSAGWIIGTLSGYLFAGEKSVFWGEWLGAGASRNTSLQGESQLAQPVWQSPPPWPAIDLRVSMWPTQCWPMRHQEGSTETFGKVISVQFSCSVVSNSLQPMDSSMPGFPVHHQLAELAQAHVHHVGDAIQPSHPLLGKLFTPWLKVRQRGLLFYLEAFTFSLLSGHLWDISSPKCQASREQRWCLSHRLRNLQFLIQVRWTNHEVPQTCATHVWGLNKIILQLRSSVGADFAPPTPPGDVWQCLEMFLVAMTGGGTDTAHLVRRGQGCCQVPCNAWDQPHSREWSDQNINSAQAEKLSSVDNQIARLPLDCQEEINISKQNFF